MLAALALAPIVQAASSTQTPAERFQAGVEAFRAGDHRAASSLWRGLLDERGTELDPGLLCYDLGNAAFRAGRVLEAVGWYTAALRFDPRNQAGWANLEL